MKIDRQEKILEIIKKYDVGTQEQLLDMLKKKGINSTQATVSRDIKHLNLKKVLGKNGEYKYEQVNSKFTKNKNDFTSLFSSTVVSIDYSRNIIVLKTISGMAQGICAKLDTLKLSDIVGTIAGDDTIFIVTKENADVKNVVTDFKKLI